MLEHNIPAGTSRYLVLANLAAGLSGGVSSLSPLGWNCAGKPRSQDLIACLGPFTAAFEYFFCSSLRILRVVSVSREVKPLAPDLDRCWYL